MERLEGMRHSRLGNGETECILCGETFRFYHTPSRCVACGKMTCGKCGLEYLTGNSHSHNQHNDNKSSDANSSLSSSSSVTSLLTNTIGGLLGSGVSGVDDGKDRVWYCKICGEQRETWKKSGAWFFKVSKFYPYYHSKYIQYRVRQNLKI